MLEDDCWVDGEGPIPCKCMIIGEAPGPEECKVGRPFIGQAGQFLRKALRGCDCDADPTEYRITNIVKSFPGRNSRGKIRRPSAKQISLELPYLQDEIRKVQPKFILALGNTSIKTLTGYATVASARRNGWLPLTLVGLDDKTQVLPTYHPSYILQGFGRSYEAVWLSDIKVFVTACCLKN